jgi:hypothetical protein
MYGYLCSQLEKKLITRKVKNIKLIRVFLIGILGIILSSIAWSNI